MPDEPTTPTAPQAPAEPSTPTAPDLSALFPQTIGEPSTPDTTPAAPAEPAAAPTEQELADLRRRLEEAEAREQRYQQQFDMLIASRTAPTPQAPAEPAGPIVSFDDLPDAIQNPTEFKTKLAERVNQALQAGQSSQAELYQQYARAQALNDLWNRFSQQNPELAKRPSFVQGAASMTFQELSARGIDPVVLAQQNPDSLITQIAQRMQSELGTPSAPTGAGPTTSTATPTAAPGTARTQDLAGGSTPVAPPAAPSNDAPSFTDQLKKAQIESGLI